MATVTLELVEPVRLSMVFGGEDASVEEDENDDEPVERLRLDRSTARLSTAPVHLE